ncbi:MAG: DegT/DnrJ/EryC1/StrS family aminotransferase [Lentisphaeria bacterium]|nr:DegT/DnrJ/EryC1/StrS family aminotransferase [Lentisphaeria bacterium]
MAEKLAIDGGLKVREKPFPPRGLIGEEEKAAAMRLFDDAIASGNAFGYNGKYEQQYETDFAEMMGGGFADGVNSGTNAVFCAVGALRLDALSEVIVPPITDCGGIMPVVMAGCVPVVADADPRTYNTCAEQIEPLITERTRAIIVAHISGDAVDMDPVVALAKKHGLYLVEDCAQSHGTTYKGRRVGTIGDIAAFSTMNGKHHCTGGQGGVVFTRNEKLHWQGRRFADRGKPFNVDPADGTNGNVYAGINCNLNDLSAAIGNCQLKKLPQMIASRVKVGNAVRDALADNPIVNVGWQVPDSQSCYWFLRTTVDPDALTVSKNQFCAALSAEGLGVNPSYRAIPSEYTWFQDKACFGTSGFPWDCSDYKGPRTPQAHIENAIEVTDRNFNITMHESCGDQEVADIVAALEKVASAYAK